MVHPTPSRQETAFTGLEAALVFIAFVVVAAVFSYVVLGAGFFTTQKSQETLRHGVEQSTATAQITGEVYGITSQENTSRWMDYVKISLGSTSGESGLDVTGMAVTYQDPSTRWPDLEYAGDPVTAADITGLPRWGILQKIHANNNTVLEPGEQFVIGVGVPNTATANTLIRIHLLPPSGVGYALERTLPASISPVMDLY